MVSDCLTKCLNRSLISILGLETESIESYDDLEFYFDTTKSCHWDAADGSEDENQADHGAEAEILSGLPSQ